MIPFFEQHCLVGGANLARWTVETKSGKWVCGRGFMSAMRDGLSYFSFLSRWNGTGYERGSGSLGVSFFILFCFLGHVLLAVLVTIPPAPMMLRYPYCV